MKEAVYPALKVARHLALYEQSNPLCSHITLEEAIYYVEQNGSLLALQEASYIDCKNQACILNGLLYDSFRHLYLISATTGQWHNMCYVISSTALQLPQVKSLLMPIVLKCFWMVWPVSGPSWFSYTAEVSQWEV